MIEFKLTIENQRSFNLCTCEELRKVSLCFAFSKSFKFDAYNTCENATCKTQHYDGWMRRWKQARFKGNTKWAVYGALHRLCEEKKKILCWLQFCEFHGLFVFPSWILSEGDASWFWHELDKQRLKIPLFWGKTWNEMHFTELNSKREDQKHEKWKWAKNWNEQNENCQEQHCNYL